jgi:hypothetical protein
MTIEEFRSILVEMIPGKYAQLDYADYERLFPPGEPDETAREACYNFAKSAGCRIENKPKSRVIWFVKDA